MTTVPFHDYGTSQFRLETSSTRLIIPYQTIFQHIITIFQYQLPWFGRQSTCIMFWSFVNFISISSNNTPLIPHSFYGFPYQPTLSVRSGGRHNPLSIREDDKTNSIKPHLLHTPFILTKKEVNDCCSQLRIIAQNKYSCHSALKFCLNNIPKLDCTH